ncbi:hypothetical protein FRC00_003668 [Tulasnella sp. 408]|nr:hypothetical protein FRC00_003668 [Tulasnella sp. 408]
MSKQTPYVNPQATGIISERSASAVQSLAKSPKTRKRRRGLSEAESAGSGQVVPPSVPPSKKARISNGAPGEPNDADSEPSSAEIPGPNTKKKKNAKRKEKFRARDQAGQAMSVEPEPRWENEEGDADHTFPGATRDEEPNESNTSGPRSKTNKKKASGKKKQKPQEDEDHPVPDATQAMTDVRSQLPPDGLRSPGSQPVVSSVDDIITSGNHEELPEYALDALSQMWHEITDPKESLYHQLEDRQDQDQNQKAADRYHAKAYRGRVCLDWLDPNTWAIDRMINNRETLRKHALAILQSVKAFGHKGAQHPIIIIVRSSELPDDIEWSDTSPPLLRFSSKTAVGIVAGAHRYMALVLYCKEADKLIESAEDYLARLDRYLSQPGLAANVIREQTTRRAKLKLDLDRLVKERNSVAHWPTLVYDWDLILAQTPEGRRLRNELSMNFTLSHRDATATERMAQIWRLSDKRGREGLNMMNPGAERILWRSSETWRPFLGHLSQFPAFLTEISGQVARYGALASASHWPGAALFVLLHSLSGLETLFEPIKTEGLDLTPEYWKQLLTSQLLKELGDLLKSNGLDLIQSGKINEWRQKHAEAYWDGVEGLLDAHFRPVGERNDKAIFHNALAGVLKERLKLVKERLLLPLYTKELRQAVFLWFLLAAPALYVIADMVDTNWMTFSSKPDQFSYGDAGSHIVRCLLARAILREGGGTQDIRDLDTTVSMPSSPFVHRACDSQAIAWQLTRYIIRGLYEPAWVSLSAWLADRKLSDPLNGEMKDRATLGVAASYTADEMDAVRAFFDSLPELTGPRAGNIESKKAADLAEEAIKQHQGERQAIEDALEWWEEWTRLRHVDLRGDWPAPLSSDATSRIATSFQRTKSEPGIWEQVYTRPEFATIFSIFQHIPNHRQSEEQLLGWAFPLPWDSDTQATLGRSSFDLDTALVHSHRSLCVLGYDPLERKVKGRKGGPPKVVTSLDNLPQSKVAQSTDPFGVGIPVERRSHFWGYMQATFFSLDKWPTYTDWPQLKAAMDRWQQMDLEWLERVMEDSPQMLAPGGDGKGNELWRMLTLGWEALAYWCITQLATAGGLGGLRNAVFPLPTLREPPVPLREVFYELELFRKGIGEGPDYPIPVPLHFAESDAVRELVRNYVFDIGYSDLVPIQPEEDDFRAVGTAWALVTAMEPEPRPRRVYYALLFTLFARETLGHWMIPESCVPDLLNLYDGRNHGALASLPTVGEVFKVLWPRVWPKQGSASERFDEEVSDEETSESPRLHNSRSTSLRTQEQDDRSQSEESDQDAEVTGGDDDVLMEEDPVVDPGSRPQNWKPKLADVQDQLEGLGIDEIDIPDYGQVLVSGKWTASEPSQAPGHSHPSEFIETPPASLPQVRPRPVPSQQDESRSLPQRSILAMGKPSSLLRLRPRQAHTL